MFDPFVCKQVDQSLRDSEEGSQPSSRHVFLFEVN